MFSFHKNLVQTQSFSTVVQTAKNNIDLMSDDQNDIFHSFFQSLKGILDLDLEQIETYLSTTKLKHRNLLGSGASAKVASG